MLLGNVTLRFQCSLDYQCLQFISTKIILLVCSFFRITSLPWHWVVPQADVIFHSPGLCVCGLCGGWNIYSSLIAILMDYSSKGRDWKKPFLNDRRLQNRSKISVFLIVKTLIDFCRFLTSYRPHVETQAVRLLTCSTFFRLIEFNIVCVLTSVYRNIHHQPGRLNLIVDQCFFHFHQFAKLPTYSFIWNRFLQKKSLNVHNELQFDVLVEINHSNLIIKNLFSYAALCVLDDQIRGLHAHITWETPSLVNLWSFCAVNCLYVFTLVWTLDSPFFHHSIVDHRWPMDWPNC